MRLATKAIVSVAASVALATAVLAGIPQASAADPEGSSAARLAQRPLYTFVAAPDFLNQDVGDVRSLPGWDVGEPNSWTPNLEAGIDLFLDDIEAQDPQSVLVAGDLVEGHWLEDVDNTGVFGEVTGARQLIRRAGDFYHGLQAQRFAERGLRLHAAVGDHDIGDNPWRGRDQKWALKRSTVPTYKDVFADHYTRTAGGHRYASRPVGTPWEDTAYSVRLAPDVLLVTLDVFHLTSNNVKAEVVDGQLAWLRDTLKKANARGTRWIIVQGHTPIASPVRARASSNLLLEGGTDSPLWRTMARHGVDLYIAGEVHDTTMRRADRITQVSTGGLLYMGAATYMAAKVYRNRIDLDVREFRSTPDPIGPLWQLGIYKGGGGPIYEPGSHSVGTLTLTGKRAVADATGKLVRYRP